MNKTALLIGANGGVGLAVAQALLEADYEVVATVSRREAIAAVQENAPGCVQVEVLDLSNADAVKERIVQLVYRLDSLDAVVVCAAVAPFAPAEMTPFAQFRSTMEVNCLSNLAVYQACLPALRVTKGRFILTGSWSGRVATPMMTSYVASKFALEGLADVLRQEAGEWGVQVILVQPGALDTQMMRRTQASLAEMIASLPENERNLYGALYRQMKYRADEGLQNKNYTPPKVIAETVVAALQADTPDTRYPVGEDTKFMFELARSKSDREIDEFILEMYRSAPVEQDRR